MRCTCNRTSNDWKFYFLALPQNLDKNINSFHIQILIPPKEFLPKYPQKKKIFKVSNSLHRTWRPKTLSGLFFKFLTFEPIFDILSQIFNRKASKNLIFSYVKQANVFFLDKWLEAGSLFNKFQRKKLRKKTNYINYVKINYGSYLD